MTESRIARYAELLVDTCVGVQPGPAFTSMLEAFLCSDQV